MKELVPYIKCNSKIWEYVKPYLLKWGYVYVESGPDWNNEPCLIIDYGGKLGNMTSMNYDHDERRELVDVETFLERAAKLKGTVYVKDMKKSDLKSGMVVQTRSSEKFLVVNDLLINKTGFMRLDDFETNLKHIGNLNMYDIQAVFSQSYSWGLGFKGGIEHGQMIWKRKEVKEFTIEEIAKKLNIPIDEFKIVGIK